MKKGIERLMFEGIFALKTNIEKIKKLKDYFIFIQFATL